MDNESVAAQIGCKKQVVSYIVHKARKRGVHIPRAPWSTSKQTSFEKAIKKFL